mmetsp:Transcript_3470/g.10692  ORF Transcript_3470/g.10692 Transcript_3470/m.10692 type:complete len:230 (-) Transcript_3470:1068-1757(-)
MLLALEVGLVLLHLHPRPDGVRLLGLAVVAPLHDLAVDAAARPDLVEAHLLEVLVGEVAEHLEVDPVPLEQLCKLAERPLLEPRLDVDRVGVDEERVHLERLLAVLLLEPLDELHRAPHLGVLCDAEGHDVLLGQVDQVDQLPVARAHEEGGEVLDAPHLELLLHLLAAEQRRVLLLGRPCELELFDRLGEVVLGQRDELLTRGSQVESLVHAVGRPLQQVVSQPAVVL